MSDEHRCAFCTNAPATTSILRRPACNGCGDAIATFYRCETAAVVEQARKERERTP